MFKSLVKILMPVVALAGFLGCSSNSDSSRCDVTAAGASTPDVIIDARRPGASLERRLNAGHVHDTLPTEAQLELAPTFWRRVASAANRMHWDCDSESFEPVGIAHYHEWLDGLFAAGVEPFIALSYVPECLARNEHPKSPPADTPEAARAYEIYIEAFLHEFVSGRIALEKQPLRYLEAWNEPDIPFDPGNISNGHGFLGSPDEFAERIFVPLGRAVMAEQQRSGIDIQLGVAASFDSRPFIDVYPTLSDLFETAGIGPALAGAVGPLAEQLFDLAFDDGFEGRWGRGGFEWSDRLVAAADAEEIEIDLVTWHHYVQNPFEGTGPACLFPDALNFLQRRNPRATVMEYFEDAVAWGQRYPGKEIFVTEWGLSAGCDDRPEYEIAAFRVATLIAMHDGGMNGAVELRYPSEGPLAMAVGMFSRMAATTVPVDLLEDRAETATWALASIDGFSSKREQGEGDRLTLLAAQWHSLEENASARELDVAVCGLPAGSYDVALHRIDRAHDGATVADEVRVLEVTSGTPARLAVPLDGQAATFLDVRPR